MHSLAVWLSITRTKDHWFDRAQRPCFPTWTSRPPPFCSRLQGITRRVQYVPEPYESFTIRASPLKAARISVVKSSGSSQAAKWPPLSTSLK